MHDRNTGTFPLDQRQRSAGPRCGGEATLFGQTAHTNFARLVFALAQQTRLRTAVSPEESTVLVRGATGVMEDTAGPCDARSSAGTKPKCCWPSPRRTAKLRASGKSYVLPSLHGVRVIMYCHQASPSTSGIVSSGAKENARPFNHKKVRPRFSSPNSDRNDIAR